MPRHLSPTAPIAADALLPGDPKRAMELAVALMEAPVMSNLTRGLWGYHGTTADGHELTVQSTGIGGPSAAVVVTELAELGVRRAIRVGTCTALDPALEAGAAIVVEAALPGDGVGSALARGGAVAPDATLTESLTRAIPSGRPATVASTDLYYEADSRRRRNWHGAGAVAVELSAAALLTTAPPLGVAVACVLVVAESAAGERLADDALEASVLAVGERAAQAL
jgi:uridine phosphorylase